MSLTKKIRGAAAKAFGKTVTVAGIVQLSPRVVRLQLHGEALRGLDCPPGAKIKLHIGEGQLRSYTPASFDPTAGRMDIVFHVHGDSPASDWVTGLHADDDVNFMGPASSVKGPTEAIPWAVFYGDETTIGLAEAIADALPDSTPLLGAIEVDAAERDATAHLKLDAATRGEIYGQALVQHLAQLQLPDGAGTIWLSGEAGSVLALRQALLDRGVAREQLCIKPYWSLKGKAHRKELEQTVFAQ